MVTFLIAVIGGAIGLVAGFLAGAFAGAGIAAATHMSNFEGAAGYFAVLCGLFGAVIGLFLGVWVALRIRGGPKSFAAVIVYGVLSAGSLLAAAAGVIALMLFFDGALNRGSSKPQALFEIRMPPGSKLADDRRGVRIELNTDKNSADAFISKEQHDDGDRPVISGGVELAFRTSSRIIVLKMKGEPDRLFRLNLSGRPGHSDDYGPWQPIDWVAEADAQQPRRATAADQYEIRYRVRDPNVEYSRPIIAFELNLPAATTLPDDLKSIEVKAFEAANDMDGAINAETVKRDGDRLTLGGTVQLAGELHSLIAITIPNQPTRLFEIKLPPLTWITETIRYATTSPADDNRTFGSWQDIAYIREPGQKDMRPARPEDDAKFRYMLR
jgi:hypothetical protein